MIKVTCALIVHQNKILITQRGLESDHPLKWEFPGGKIKEGETVRQSIIREILEELELKIKIQEIMITVEYDYGIKKIELIPFICSLKSGEIKLNEHLNYKWVALNNLLNFDFSEADRKLLLLEENMNILKEYTGKNMYNPG